MAATNEELRNDIADLTEKIRQVRIEQGLSPEVLPRPQIIGITLSLALVERLQPFNAIAIKYAAILAQGEVTRIDTDRLREYEDYAQLLHYSKGTFCAVHSLGARWAFQVIRSVNEAIDAGTTDMLDVNKAMRDMHFCIGFMTKNDGLGFDEYEGSKDSGISPREEAKRLLSDPAAFQSAIEEAMTQIPTTEETIDYE